MNTHDDTDQGSDVRPATDIDSVSTPARTMRDRGASLVEYGLLVALIAIACFVAIIFLGESTSEGLDSTTSSIQAAI